MSISARHEQRLINQDERAIMMKTHHPAIYREDREELLIIRKRLRDIHDRERTLAWQRRRSARGKAEERGRSFPGDTEKSARRKQVFAAAVKRLNVELRRRTKIEARAANVEAAQKALALRREADFVGHAFEDRTEREGMKTIPNLRRRTRINRHKVGSISQAVKASQARRDKR